MRPCNSCGVELPEDFPAWRKVCIACFKRAKQDEVAELKRSLHEAELRLEREKAKAKRALYEAELLLRSVGTTADAFVDLDRAMVTRILSLCHPDRHGNSASSNDVTRYLIDLRGRLPVAR